MPGWITTTTTSIHRRSSTARSSRRGRIRIVWIRSNMSAMPVSTCVAAGVLGGGGWRRERAGLITQLANMEPYPESVPVNNLVQVEGTPLTGTAPLDPFEFVRTIAVARITMPKAMVRLSAGREQMDEAVPALCFLAGANSIFYGDQLLTTSNPQAEADRNLLERLGMQAQTSQQVQ